MFNKDIFCAMKFTHLLMPFVFSTLIFTGCGQNIEEAPEAPILLGDMDIYERSYSDSSVLILILEDDDIQIEGDTLEAIQLMLAELAKARERESILLEVIEKSVDFANNVSEKNKIGANKIFWESYVSALEKIGFEIVFHINVVPPSEKKI